MVEKVALKDINRFLMFGVLVCVILYFARQVLIPVAFSVFFAMLFTSLSNRMEQAGVKRIFTALISLLIIVVVTFGIGALVYWQATKLAEELPEMEKKMEAFTDRAEDYIGQKTEHP